MDLVRALIGFLFGAGFGSAANALVDRLPREESWVSGRSKCDHCKHVLGVRDLIPLLSFVALQGKCRYCGKKIPARNFFVELLMGTAVSLIAINMWSAGGAILALILWVTTIIAVMDWETLLVSEFMVVAWGILVVGWQWFSGGMNWNSSLTGMAAAVGVIGGIWAISRGRAMGFGDVEIAAVLGWWLGGTAGLVALWMAFVTGAIAGGIKIVLNKSHLKSQIAFGPFLIIGSWIAFLWGEKILAIVFP